MMEKRERPQSAHSKLALTQRSSWQILVTILWTEFSALDSYTIGVEVEAAGLGLLLDQGTTSKLTLLESTIAPSQQPRRR